MSNKHKKKCGGQDKCEDTATCDFQQELCLELEIEVEAECTNLEIKCTPCDD